MQPAQTAPADSPGCLKHQGEGKCQHISTPSRFLSPDCDPVAVYCAKTLARLHSTIYQFKFKESQKQGGTESHVLYPVAATVAASSHCCRTSSCVEMGHRGRFLFQRGRMFSEGSKISSRTLCCVSMGCKGFTVVWTCWLVAASPQCFFYLNKENGFSVLMNIVRFCSNRRTRHSTLEHTSCQCIGGRTVKKSTPHRTRTCKQQFSRTLAQGLLLVCPVQTSRHSHPHAMLTTLFTPSR